jgi:hypothetical protein
MVRIKKKNQWKKDVNEKKIFKVEKKYGWKKEKFVNWKKKIVENKGA